MPIAVPIAVTIAVWIRVLTMPLTSPLGLPGARVISVKTRRSSPAKLFQNSVARIQAKKATPIMVASVHSPLITRAVVLRRRAMPRSRVSEKVALVMAPSLTP